jgi:uncharacterized protein (UPF0335 family)
MTKQQPKKRSKNLGDDEIKQIVEILDGWFDKLSWELLIDAIELRMFNRYTRQALYKHERIRHAFELKKNELSGGGTDTKRVASPQLQIALDRIARLEAENRRLESENNMLLEQYARWAYNAHTRGLDHEFLNRPLPSVNRGQTKR